MFYEIDFLPVGSGERSGDAIALRFGAYWGSLDQKVVIVDGGTRESGGLLAEHVRSHYGTNVVDLVISTHPDADHICGLAVVLQELVVRELWMHRPWHHNLGLWLASQTGSPFRGRLLSEHGLRSLRHARELEEAATRAGVPVYEPFAGRGDGSGHLVVIGPSWEYYAALLQNFDSGGWNNPNADLKRLVAQLLGARRESWALESLLDLGETSARNNSSVILALVVDGRVSLLTGDAGAPALHSALEFAESRVFNRADLRLVQVPHHGSDNNVGPSVLDRLLGPRLPFDLRVRDGIVSSSAGAPDHPAPSVTNAFRRRGTVVYATQGRQLCHRWSSPPRRGWFPVEPISFHSRA